MLTSNNRVNYNSIDNNNTIKTDDRDHDSILSLSRKDLCIYLIGIITGIFLILFISKKIGMDYIHDNNYYNNNNNNNNKVVTSHGDAIGEDVIVIPTPAPTPLPPTTNVLFSELKAGDFVKISGYDTYQVLRNPSSSNKVKMVSDRDTERVRWEIGYSASRQAFSFKNVEQGCYLRHGYPYLKCLSDLGDRSYWRKDAGTWTDIDDGIKYQRLKNYGNNKCPYITRDSNKIDMEKTFCNWDQSYVDVLRYDYK